MNKKKTTGSRVVVDEAGYSPEAPPAVTMVTPATDSPRALLDFAEELGQLLARRELARRSHRRKHRRGYSLPELLLGAAVMALFWVLIAKASGMLPR